MFLRRVKGLLMSFSAFKILKEGLTGNRGWAPHWREPSLKKEYDVIVIGLSLIHI